MSISETSNVAEEPAIRGENTAGGSGVVGQSTGGRGVVGLSDTDYGVTGDSQSFPGVRGTSVTARGVEGWSTDNDGVWGISTNAAGVHGVSNSIAGVVGESTSGRGVQGTSTSWQGVFGLSQTNAGVVGESPQFHGIFGVSHDSHNAGVFGTNDSAGGFGLAGVSPNGIGVNGKGGVLAGRFEGNIEVWGDIRLAGADCAEEFSVVDGGLTEPGTVMVLAEDGAVRTSSSAYDTRVAGVVAGGGSYRPGIILDRQSTSQNRTPLALVGKAFCKVDADYSPVRVGDLLTTSDTQGHAMKACEPLRAFGAVIGKALAPLSHGQALVPILVTLQ